jgi:hypothetical protein
LRRSTAPALLPGAPLQYLDPSWSPPAFLGLRFVSRKPGLSPQVAQHPVARLSQMLEFPHGAPDVLLDGVLSEWSAVAALPSNAL